MPRARPRAVGSAAVAAAAAVGCLLLVLLCARVTRAARLQVPTETQLEVERWFALYADVVDHRNFDEYSALFHPDARPDYTASGGRTGTVAEMRDWLQGTFQFLRAQHLVSNIVVLSVPGGGGGADDRIRARAMLHNPMSLVGLDLVYSPLFVFGGWYFVDLVRNGDGDLVASSMHQETFYNNAGSSIALLVLLVAALVFVLRAALCRRRAGAATAPPVSKKGR